MTNTRLTQIDTSRRTGVRTPLRRVGTTRVRTWTGRSHLSIATSTPRPYLATAGTRYTRVSGMRDSARAVTARSSAAIDAGPHTARRRGRSTARDIVA